MTARSPFGLFKVLSRNRKEREQPVENNQLKDTTVAPKETTNIAGQSKPVRSRHYLNSMDGSPASITAPIPIQKKHSHGSMYSTRSAPTRFGSARSQSGSLNGSISSSSSSSQSRNEVWQQAFRNSCR